ncbi:hypothetical protein BD310DRAFT_938998 [Dichomitus squalens]|uniref:Uncharacterized protein n=1 Tax=Dichomitus squalens TaxID=114155 RepID=A0A4Q9PI80_9APHY|nr:hypothetical protein BD310DRAFT_938998 [Dichomitus squalens]
MHSATASTGIVRHRRAPTSRTSWLRSWRPFLSKNASTRALGASFAVVRKLFRRAFAESDGQIQRNPCLTIGEDECTLCTPIHSSTHTTSRHSAMVEGRKHSLYLRP